MIAFFVSLAGSANLSLATLQSPWTVEYTGKVKMTVVGFCVLPY